MGMKDRILGHLATLEPELLEVIDESDHHRGHGGWREGGNTHFRVRIRGGALAGLSRIDAHRRINTLLAPEFALGLHALAIEIPRA